jgi:hypothetical protein
MCMPLLLPRHLQLDLSQYVLQDVSRFRLRVHTLKAETISWNNENSLLCDRCACEEIQDNAHALLMCRDADVSVLRRKFASIQLKEKKRKTTQQNIPCIK